MKLTMPQQLKLLEAARSGVGLFDALILVGVPLAEVEAMLSNHDARAAHAQGRAEGAKQVREVLVRESERGNISAAKALRLHEEAEEEPPPVQQSKSVEDILAVDVLPGIRRMFAKQRALIEGNAVESDDAERTDD